MPFLIKILAFNCFYNTGKLKIVEFWSQTFRAQKRQPPPVVVSQVLLVIPMKELKYHFS